MFAARITAMGGMVPRTARHLIQDHFAQSAVNVKLTTGDIVALRRPLQIKSVTKPGDIKTMMRLEDAGGEYWLTWSDDVDAVRGPVAGDVLQRVYYTGDGEPRMTVLAQAISGLGNDYPKNFFVLGVTRPITAPSVSHGGGSGSVINRAFIYTFVTQYGEESQPSPPSTSTAGRTDGTWTVASMDAAPPNSYTISAASWLGGVLTLTVSTNFGLRKGENIAITGLAPTSLNATWPVRSVAGSTTITIAMDDPGTITDQTGTATRLAPHNVSGMTKNVYWSNATTGAYELVANVPVATTSTNVAGNTVPTGSLVSADYEMPPVGMRGLCVLANGSLAGFDGNVIRVSEPLQPHAWPADNSKTCDFQIVGIGAFGTNIGVATEGFPYVATVADPSSISMERFEVEDMHCLSKRSVRGVGVGTAYVGASGPVLLTASGPQRPARLLYTKDEWSPLNPTSMFAATHQGRYYVAFTPLNSETQMLTFDFAERAQLSIASAAPSAMYADPRNGELYLALGRTIYQWDADIGMRYVSDWLSKEYKLPTPINLGAAKIDFDSAMTSEEKAAAQAAYDAVVALNAALISGGNSGGALGASALCAHALAGDAIQTPPPLVFDYIGFTLYADNEAKFTTQVKSQKAFRLPAGYKADNFAIRVSANVIVRSITVAETMKGLAAA